MDLGQLVRRSCHRVSRAATLVRIHDDRLETVARSLVAPLTDAAARPRPGPGTAGPEDPELTAARVITLNAVNFGSGYHDVVDKEAGLSGARTMARRWDRHLAGTVPAPESLATVTADECARIFGQSLAHPDQRELMELFATALAALGSFVAERFDGSYLAVVEAAGGSAEALASSLLTMPLYVDRWSGAHDVHFYKRAQITAADLARAFAERPPGRFHDLDRLTAFADNLVPHVLRVERALVYDPDLADHIDRGQRLALGSPAELEIRAAGIEGVERLVATLAASGVRTRSMDVDAVLWSRGGEPRYKAVPRHRTRCTFY